VLANRQFLNLLKEITLYVIIVISVIILSMSVVTKKRSIYVDVFISGYLT
jgi:hypothetical protein